MKRMTTIATVGCMVALVLLCCGACAETPRSGGDETVPWWEQGKIRFFWMPWYLEFHPLPLPQKSAGTVDPLSDEVLIERVADMGGTVFTDRNHWTFNDELTESDENTIKGAYKPE